MRALLAMMVLLGLAHDAAADIAPPRGARERAYAEMVGAGLNPDQMTALTRAAHSGWALGGADFIAELQRRTERRVARAAAGRPPKPAEN